MSKYDVVIMVFLRESILDPQGQAVKTALHSLGFDIESVRIGKTFTLTLEAENANAAMAKAAEICESTVGLYNPVMENYEMVTAHPVR